MWPSGEVLRCRRHTHGDPRPKGGALQSRRSTCGTESTGQAAASCNAGGWLRRRLNAHHTTSPTACPAAGRRGKKCQLVDRGHMSLWTICRKLDCAGVSRPGLGMAVPLGPESLPLQSAIGPPALWTGGPRVKASRRFRHRATTRTAAVRALAARTGETTESARPCTPLWRLPRARSTLSCCLAWWIRQTRPRHRRPSLSPL